MNDDALKVTTIDLGLYRPNMASSHLVVAGESAALIDVGATQNHLQILTALRQRNVSFESVKFIFVTHIHLDHAGAAGFLLAHFFPNARLVVHPLGLAHMQQPAKLEAAACQVYGQEVFAKVYGALVPVPAERLIAAVHGMQCDLATGTILEAGQKAQTGTLAEIIHTPGHARHHYCLHLPEASCVFTGDAYGLAYPELVAAGQAFLLPTTTPTAFEPEEMLRSVEKIASLGAKRAYLTHFGLVHEPAQYLEPLQARIRKLVDCAKMFLPCPEHERQKNLLALECELVAWLKEELEKHGCNVKIALELLDLDIKLNVQGLAVWASRQ